MRYFTKHANKLRSALKLVEMFPGSKAFSGAKHIDLAGKRIGSIGFDPTTKMMESIQIKDKYQGMGIGKKIYGDLIREHGYMLPTNDRSQAAKHL